jgi:hypothetical protein
MVKDSSLAKARAVLCKRGFDCGKCTCLFGACDIDSPNETGVLCSKYLGSYIDPKKSCQSLQLAA